MKFIRGLHNIRSYHKGCIVTIGNFDGFHYGHQKLISTVQKLGRYYNLPIMVIIFEPLPKEYLFRKTAVRLTTLRDKINYLFKYRVDYILCVKFNEKFSSLSAESFVRYILIEKLEIKFICIGDDFRFGAYKEGDFSFLKKISENKNFKIIRITTLYDRNGIRISSTAVRLALLEDRTLDAKLLLGHSYCISGRVIHGNKLGHVFGYPTANIFLQSKRFPIHGVWVVEVYGIISNIPLLGIANIGIHPTIFRENQQILEVHLLNLNMDLYYRYIKVIFLLKLRNEKFFNSFQKLQDQIEHDILKVKKIFNYKYYLNKIITGRYIYD